MIKPSTAFLFTVFAGLVLPGCVLTAKPSIESVEPAEITTYKPAEVVVRLTGDSDDARIVLEVAAQRAKSETSAAEVRQGVNYGGQRKGTIQGNTLYVADWFSGLHIYDISNPAQPRLLSTFHTPGSAKGVAVRGHYAFIADDDHGLQIVDVGDPADPVWVSGLATSGLAYMPVIVGDRLYLASHRGGVHIIDIGNPAEPRMIGGFDTPGKAWALAVDGDRVYVADAVSGLLIFDIHDMQRPRQIGRFNPGGNAEDVVVHDGLVYIAFFDLGLFILDVSKPDDPVVQAHVPTPGNARGVLIDHGHAYVADWQAGMHILDVHNPDKPVRLGGFDTDGAAWGMQIKGKIAYVFDWWGGMATLDIADPGKIVKLDRYPERGTVRRVALDNGFLYAVNDAGLQVFDVNNPLNPIWSTSLDMAKGANNGLVVRDGVVLMADGNRLVFVDGRNPFQLRRAADLSLPSPVVSMALAGARAYVADSDGLIHVFDVADLSHPRPVGTIQAQARDLWLQDGRLYVADAGQGVGVYDVGDDAKPVRGSFASGVARMIRGRGNTVIAHEKGGFVSVFDLSDLSRTGSFEVNGEIVDMQWRDDMLFVLTRAALFEIDAADPFAMRLVSRYALDRPATELAVGADAVYLAGGMSPSPMLLMPEIDQAHEVGVIRINIPAGMPAGVYDLRLVTGAQESDIRRGALRVKALNFSKPRLSKEAFDKLLKQMPKAD